jgi:hypothetical protein
VCIVVMEGGVSPKSCAICELCWKHHVDQHLTLPNGHIKTRNRILVDLLNFLSQIDFWFSLLLLGLCDI